MAMACKFFQINRCMKGNNCPFSHELVTSQQAAPQPNPAATESKVCFNFQKGTCKFGDKCKYLHTKTTSSSEANPAPPARHAVATKAKRAQKPGSNKMPVEAKQKLPRATFERVLKHVTSLPGLQFPQQDEFRLKDVRYSIANGRVRANFADGRSAEYLLPRGHTTVDCLASYGLVSFNPRQMLSVNLSDHTLSILCQADLSPLSSPVRIQLPLQQGVTKYLVQGTTVILFKPYSDVHVGKEYYESVFIYRWNNRERAFVHALTWSADGFHIVCASSTSEYVAISRLPYNPAALEEAYQKELLHQRTQEDISKITHQLTVLTAQMREAERLRKEAEERQRIETERIERQRRERAEQYRRADPMDLFVWDRDSRGFTRVLEYTKPVDDLHVSGRRLYVRIGQFTYVFDILLEPSRLHQFSWKNYRVEVDRLTADC